MSTIAVREEGGKRQSKEAYVILIIQSNSVALKIRCQHWLTRIVNHCCNSLNIVDG